MLTSELYDKHGKLPPFDPNVPGSVFADGKSDRNTSVITRSFNQIYPGLFANHPNLIEFQREFSALVNKEFSIDLDPVDGTTKTGYYRNFDSIRTISGYFQSPLSAIPFDNHSFIVEEKGLNGKYTKEQKQIAENVWDIVFASYKHTTLKVAPISNTGPPRRTHDFVFKRDYALNIINERFEYYLDTLCSGDVNKTVNELEVCFLMDLQKRGQVDIPGKARYAFTIDEVLNHPMNPKTIATDKAVWINGMHLADFSAMRARTIHAGPFTLNAILQLTFSGHMASLFSRFPRTFHVNTPEDIKSIIDGKLIWCGDVHNYDNSMTEESILIPHERMAKVWDERIVDISKWLYFSAYYARPLDVDGRSGHFVGDFMNYKEPQVKCGNRSGHAMTSLMAKVNKVIETLWIFHEMGYNVIGNEEVWLEGNMHMGVINNGDDECVWFKYQDDYDKFVEIRSNHPDVIYEVSREDGQIFSGLTLIKTAERTYQPTQRVHTAFEKIYVPERSIGGKIRPYWFIGVMERINNPPDTLIAHNIWDLHNQMYHKHLRPVVGDLFTMLMDEAMMSDISMEGLSYRDRQLLMDPDKIYYKYADEDVSKQVLDKVVRSIEAKEVAHIPIKYYRGERDDTQIH